LCTLVLVAFSALYAVRVTGASSKTHIPGTYAHYRFTALQARNGSTPVMPGISDFGLLRLGEASGAGAVSNQGYALPCKALHGAKRVVEGASMWLEVPSNSSRSDFHSWYIVTLEGDNTEMQDAVRFILEASDDKEAWTTVGSSSHVHYLTDVVFTQGVAAVPRERGAPLSFDASWSSEYFFFFFVMSLPQYVLLLITVLLSHFGKPQLVKPSLLFTLGFQVIMRFICAVLFLVRESRMEPSGGPHGYALTVYSVMWTLTGMAGFAIVALFEEAFEVFFFIGGGVRILLQVTLHQQLFGRFISLTPSAGHVPASLAWIAVGAIIAFFRIKHLRWAVIGVQPGRLAYDAAWQSIVSDRELELDRLQVVVRRIKGRTASCTTVQITRGVPSGALDRVLLNNILRQDPRDAKLQKMRELASGPSGDVALESASSVVVASTLGLPPPPSQSSNQVAPMLSPHTAGLSGTASPTGSFTRTFSSVFNLFINDNVNVNPGGVTKGTWTYFAASVLQSERLNNLVCTWATGPPVSLSPSPVRSLDQLHSQAFLVHDVFAEWVVGLAQMFKGKFKLRPQSSADSRGGARFAEWDGDGEWSGKFALGGIKAVSSCVEKLDVAYGRDVSLMLDMVRETLYFEAISDIETCLEQIEADPRVEIVRIKSTMHTDGEGDPVCFSGLRFVSVYVRFTGSEDARSLCVDTHVCELLLLLTDIGRVQTAKMHSAYKELRRCRRSMSKLGRVTRWIVLHGTTFSGANGQQISPDNSKKVLATGTSGASQAASAEDGTAHPEHGDGAAAAAAGGGGGDVNQEGATPAAAQSAREGDTPAPGAGGPRRIVAMVRRTGSDPLLVRVGSVGSIDVSEWAVTSFGLPVGPKMLDLLEDLGRMNALGISDFLDRRWDAVRTNMVDTSSLGSLFFSTCPVSAALQKWQWQIFCFLSGLFTFIPPTIGALSSHPRHRLRALVCSRPVCLPCAPAVRPRPASPF